MHPPALLVFFITIIILDKSIRMRASMLLDMSIRAHTVPPRGIILARTPKVPPPGELSSTGRPKSPQTGGNPLPGTQSPLELGGIPDAQSPP